MPLEARDIFGEQLEAQLAIDAWAPAMAASVTLASSMLSEGRRGLRPRLCLTALFCAFFGAASAAPSAGALADSPSLVAPSAELPARRRLRLRALLRRRPAHRSSKPQPLHGAAPPRSSLFRNRSAPPQRLPRRGWHAFARSLAFRRAHPYSGCCAPAARGSRPHRGNDGPGRSAGRRPTPSAGALGSSFTPADILASSGL